MKTRMNATFQCIVLLACVVTCTSIVTKRCLCLTTKDLDPRWLIVDIKERSPRPYCSKYEVIAILKSGRSLCLNPGSNDTMDTVRTFRKTKEEAAKRVTLNSIGRETTTTTTTTVSTKTPPKGSQGGTF